MHARWADRRNVDNPRRTGNVACDDASLEWRFRRVFDLERGGSTIADCCGPPGGILGDVAQPSDLAPRLIVLVRYLSARGRRRRREVRPSFEAIEPRALLSGYSPTDIEQYYLELLDDARFNPAAYGVSLGLDLSSDLPAQPLAMNTLLVEAARLHSQDMITNDYFSHVSPEGADPGDRIAATGFAATSWAESIETDTNPSQPDGTFPANYAAWDAGYSLSNLIVDAGVPDLGHRVMLLDIGGGDQTMRQVGIGIASQVTASGGYNYDQTDTTIDLASVSDPEPFLTGVVFDDTTGNGEYEPGEGLSGVTITVSGVGSTATLDAGGYSLQVAPGVYTVTASGGGLPSAITRTVVVGDDNAQLNFDEDPNGATITADSTGTVNGLLGSFTAIASGDTAASYSARIDWGDGNASYATLTPGVNGTFDVEGSETYANPGVYAVRVLITHLSDGQTITLNATAIVNSSTYSGQAFPNPAYPGEGGTGTVQYPAELGSGIVQTSSSQGGGSSGQAGSGSTTAIGATTGDGTTAGSSQGTHHKKKHHKAAPKTVNHIHIARVGKRARQVQHTETTDDQKPHRHEP